MPPRPGGVATAAIVSCRFKIAAGRSSCGLGAVCRHHHQGRFVRGVPVLDAGQARSGQTHAGRTHGRLCLPAARRQARSVAAEAGKVGDGGHAGRIDHNASLRTRATTLAAHFRFVPQSYVDDAALAAVHGVKAEIVACMPDLLGCRKGADTQFFDAQRPVIVRIERYARMIVGMHAQHFLSNQFQSQQQFRTVGKKQIDVVPAEFDEQDRDSRSPDGSGRPASSSKTEPEARVVDHPGQKLFDPWARVVNRIPDAQVRFLLSFVAFDEVIFFCEAAITVTGGAVLLKNHCWPI